MCGRYSMTLSSADMAGRFGVDLSGLTLKPRYNLAPGQEAPVILANTNGRQAKMMQWGLIPHWAKDPAVGFKTSNARPKRARRSCPYE